jgi:hypothetical protein
MKRNTILMGEEIITSPPASDGPAELYPFSEDGRCVKYVTNPTPIQTPNLNPNSNQNNKINP